ncbi:MAG TPA: hypothetical protein VMU19_06820 [Bryobacteraceae bacterium]|nr:hypothetical protein [Bryobacteraceae bacterium]
MGMIVTRTPFRISFAGGGSDLPSFCEREPGMVLTAAIDQYMYLAVKPRFGGTYRISYSTTEICETAGEVRHPIVRECLRLTGSARGLEIVSIADLPAGSGMGSSSSFTVGLLAALRAWRGEEAGPEQLAREACEVEIGRLGEPIGRQDQYIAAYGGMRFLRFLPGGRVKTEAVACARSAREELSRRLMLFFTGDSRAAREILGRQNARAESNREALRELCGIARSMRERLEQGADLDGFGRLLHEAWERKKTLEASISNPAVDRCYALARDAGALGGKLLGAGGGGFLLFYCDPAKQAAVREALAGMPETRFGFEPQGARIVYRD